MSAYNAVVSPASVAYNEAVVCAESVYDSETAPSIEDAEEIR